MNSSWGEDWLEIQKRYLQALRSFEKPGVAEQKAKALNPDWQKHLNDWWQTMQASGEDVSPAAFSDLFQNSQSWNGLAPQFNALLACLSASEKDGSDWQSVLAEHIEKMKSQLAESFTNVDMGLWPGPDQSPTANFQKQFEGMFSAIPGLNFDPGYAGLSKTFENLFANSGDSPKPFIHEDVQEGLRLWHDYENNYQAYRAAMNDIAIAAMDKLKTNILTVASQESSIRSLRELYNLWVDSQEEAYFEYALSETYSALYGDLINSALAFKAHTQKLYSESLSKMNLAESGQVDGLIEELHDIKQQLADDKNHIKFLEEKVKRLESSSAKTMTSSKKKIHKKPVAKK